MVHRPDKRIEILEFLNAIMIDNFDVEEDRIDQIETLEEGDCHFDNVNIELHKMFGEKDGLEIVCKLLIHLKSNEH